MVCKTLYGSLLSILSGTCLAVATALESCNPAHRHDKYTHASASMIYSICGRVAVISPCSVLDKGGDEQRGRQNLLIKSESLSYEQSIISDTNKIVCRNARPMFSVSVAVSSKGIVVSWNRLYCARALHSAHFLLEMICSQ